MGKGTVKFNSNWQTTFSWLKPVRNDDSMGHCDYCMKKFQIDNGGISQVIIIVNIYLYHMILIG